MLYILQQFVNFIKRGSVIDLAIGMVMGAAFTGIVKSLCNDLFMPVFSLLFPYKLSENFVMLKCSNSDGFMGWRLGANCAARYGKNGKPSLAQAIQDGTVIWNYGAFIEACITFLIMAWMVFIVVKVYMKILNIERDTGKQCPFCKENIHSEALRCPRCTSALEHAPSAKEGSRLTQVETKDRRPSVTPPPGPTPVPQGNTLRQVQTKI